MGAAGWYSVSQLGWGVLLWVQLDGILLASPGGVSYCGCGWVAFCQLAQVECLTVDAAGG